mgnify:CR=1 FL=1
MPAAAIAGAAVIGAVASNSAASKQAASANKATEGQNQATARMRADLAPYSDLGQTAINPLWAAMGYQRVSDPNAVASAQQAIDAYRATAAQNGWDRYQPKEVQRQLDRLQGNLNAAREGPLGADPNSILQQQFQFDPSQLDQTPGYQFALTQGLKNTNNSLAAQGLQLSGAQAKGLSQYATGLADQTYGDQYNRALSTFNTNTQLAQNNVGNLQNLVNVGQNSAAQQGQASVSGAANAGNFQVQSGNAQAAGIMGVGNAAQNGANNYMLYNALYGK